MPFCNTILFAGGVTDYFCNSLRVSTAQLAVTTYPGQVGRTFEQTVLSDTSTPTRRSSTTTPSHTGSAMTSHTPAPSSSSSTPVGAIVGGVIGGVAVLAIIAFGVFFILRRSKKPDPASPPPAPETVQNHHPSPFPNPSPGPANLSPSPGPTNLSPSPTAGSKPGHQSVASSYNPAYPPSAFTSGPPSADYSGGPQFQQQQQFQAYQPPANEQGPQDWSQRYSVQSKPQQQQPGYDQQGGGGYNTHFSGQSYNVPGNAGSPRTPPPQQQQQQPDPGGYEAGGHGVAGEVFEMDGQGRPGRAYELG